MVILHRHAPLANRIRARGSPARLACCLNRGQQQRDENPDDRNYDQQLNQREAAALVKCTTIEFS